jgi:hypothetical protein
VRLLALRSELGYTDRIDRALPDEPEAVSTDAQRQITRAAHRSERDIFVACRDEIRASLKLLSGARFRHLQSDLRVIERTLERIDRRLQ